MDSTKTSPVVDKMFKVGAHFGMVRSRRHPTVRDYIFGAKNRVEIIDLLKTEELLEKAKDFVKNIAKDRGQILFVSSKSEGREALRKAAESIEMPYVAGRWIGGTFTNFNEIRKRIDRLVDLTTKREKGELGMYTKKERLLIDREIENLEAVFSGLIAMKGLPKAIFVVDSRKEHIAVTEAKKVRIPVIALTSSDCDLTEVNYPIVANDASRASIEFFLNEIAGVYREGLMSKA